MSASAITSAAPISPSAAAAPTATPRVGGVLSTVANHVRALGTGMWQAGDFMSMETDRGFIRPVEGLFALQDLVGQHTKPGGLPNKIGTKAFWGAGFGTAYYGLILEGMLKAPGIFLRDIANTVADKIDGKKTADGTFGYWTPVQPAVDAVNASRAVTPPKSA